MKLATVGTGVAGLVCACLLRREHEITDLLEPAGLALLQAILSPDQRYDAYRRSVDFIQRYVFPGGLLPSPARLLECTSRHTDLSLVDVEDLTPHYARTLVEWRRRFVANENAIAEVGLSEVARRKWLYYFSYCEGAFLERSVGNAQLLFARPGYRRNVGYAATF